MKFENLFTGKILKALLWVTAIPVLFSSGWFLSNFWDSKISSNPSDWDSVSSYFANILQVVLSILGIYVTGYIAYAVQRFTKQSAAESLRVQKQLALLQYRNAALTEFFTTKKQVFSDYRRDINEIGRMMASDETKGLELLTKKSEELKVRLNDCYDDFFKNSIFAFPGISTDLIIDAINNINHKGEWIIPDTHLAFEAACAIEHQFDIFIMNLRRFDLD